MRDLEKKRARDREYSKTHRGPRNENNRRYKLTPKGRESVFRGNHTPLGLERKRNYDLSPKGQERQRVKREEFNERDPHYHRDYSRRRRKNERANKDPR